MLAGERQVAPDASGIRRDHLERYHWAVKQLKQVCPGGRIIDLACGVGYGSKILADAGFRVEAIDRDAEAIAYAEQHYGHPNVRYRVGRAEDVKLKRADAVVCFETIEHLADPGILLRKFKTPVLLASVPNEREFPWRGHKFHFRHYTKQDFEGLLESAGFAAAEWFGQVGTDNEVQKGISGRTLVVVAKRAKTKKSVPVLAGLPPRKAGAPDTVSIIGLGPSLMEYVTIAKCYGARHRVSHEIWGLNAVLDVLACDRGFHMDDVRVQQLRADANPSGNIASMLPWLKNIQIPVFTSQPHPDYPNLIPYPLADVLNSCGGNRYFNSTAAYAVAYAIHLGVKKIMCWGMDFSYEHTHHAEKGRACVEFWLGFAQARGIQIGIPHSSTLLDACVPPRERLYGYDCVNVQISGETGSEKVSFSPRQDVPTAAEIEDRYDHSKPTVPAHLRKSA